MITRPTACCAKLRCAKFYVKNRVMWKRKPMGLPTRQNIHLHRPWLLKLQATWYVVCVTASVIRAWIFWAFGNFFPVYSHRYSYIFKPALDKNALSGRFLYFLSVVAILFVGMFIGTIMWKIWCVEIVLKRQGDHLLKVKGEWHVREWTYVYR